MYFKLSCSHVPPISTPPPPLPTPTTTTTHEQVEVPAGTQVGLPQELAAAMLASREQQS